MVSVSECVTLLSLCSQDFGIDHNISERILDVDLLVPAASNVSNLDLDLATQTFFVLFPTFVVCLILSLLSCHSL